MNEIHAAPVNSIAVIPLLLILIMAALFVAGFVMAILKHPRVLFFVGGVLAVGLLLFFVGFARVSIQTGPEFAQVSRSVIHGSDSSRNPPPSPPPPAIPPPVSLEALQNLGADGDTKTLGPVASNIEHRVGNGPALAITELPEWRKNPNQEGLLESGHNSYVRVSQQFASVAEAEEDLFTQVEQDVKTHFAQQWPETSGWSPPRHDIMESGLIREKVIETIPLKVGEFENPVYRVSWLIEFRPEVDEALHASWYPREAERRSHWLLAGLASITALLGGTSVLLRRQRTQPEPNAQTA